MDAKASVAMLRAVAEAVIANVDVLTDADLATGDGDHGIGMRRGFEAALVALDAPPATIDAAFRATGMAIMANTGGAAGAVFGTVFTAGAKAFAGQDEITPNSFRHFLADAQAAVSKRGGVVEGQKTMLDALGFAARAAAVEGDLAEAMTAAAKGAQDGVEATKAMIATTGKARSLGERSIGHPDPGAISVAIILGAMRDYTAA
ncbi:MAG: Dak phosphatase [Cypionkella sp.]|uniref:dihydroxyacetone kinase subunit DhaL n=1 Tax=Cypionkella sp. TaxID=2811411 RepID=UPI0026316374|nr:dihydroxyacetone kinase subunit DhaL [Cypionkella sp.]MDB5660538.1 Dak phosphatase [Cypionkella sp.]